MKKFFLMLLTVVGISVAAMADGRLSCTVYGTSGTKATLQAKGDCASNNGRIVIPLTITNKGTTKPIKVVVNVYDERTGSFVTSKKIVVHDYDYEIIVDNLESGKCYTVSLSNAITCE